MTGRPGTPEGLTTPCSIPRLVRESPELVRAAIAKKHLRVDLDPVLAADAAWRALLHRGRAAALRAEGGERGDGGAGKGSPEFLARLGEMKAVSAQLKEKGRRAQGGRGASREAMLTLPNLPHASVPEGGGRPRRTW